MKICLVILALLLPVIAYAEDTQRVLHITFTDAAAAPLKREQIREVTCRDLSDEPLIADIKVTDGSADIALPDSPVEVSARIDTPGFGEVVIFADNNGKGYKTPGTIDFVDEAAITRLRRVREAMKQAKREGVKIPAEFTKSLEDASALDPHKSLAATLRLGEELTLIRARHKIDQLKSPRKDFLFGCNAMGYPARGPLYQQRFREIFNYGTPNLYISHYAPQENARNYERTDNETSWLLSMGMTAKTCPPFYLAGGVIPAWLKTKPWPESNKVCHDLVLEVSKRYAGKIKFCEITNEATMSNGLGLTTEQIIEMTNTASRAAREGDPNIQRIINSAHLWGDFAARPDKQGRPKLSPYAYLRACLKAKIDFEIVGLQMYYPEFDLLEIDRMLDKYARLGKPIHITEMGCSSAPGIDPNAQRKAAAAGWHGPWTEDMQADWVEAVYTVYYSKPYIQAASWWDLADAVSFWPYGGLLRGDCSPKPAYLRLKALEEKWGFHFGADNK